MHTYSCANMYTHTHTHICIFYIILPLCFLKTFWNQESDFISMMQELPSHGISL